MSCGAPAEATIGVVYADRTVVVADLVVVPDPNLVDLCADHASRLTPPLGWRVRDDRAAVGASTV
jgi:hypothetical protein